MNFAFTVKLIPWRYIVVTVTFFATLSITAMRYCFSLTLTQMVKLPASNGVSLKDDVACPVQHIDRSSFGNASLDFEPVSCEMNFSFYVKWMWLICCAVHFSGEWEIRMVPGAAGHDFVLILYGLCDCAFSRRPDCRLDWRESGDCYGPGNHCCNNRVHTVGG